MNAKLLGATVIAVAVVTLTGAPVHAQWRDSWGTSPHDAGYRDGARAGGDDARDGRAFEYQRSRDYRQADAGYDGRHGNRDAYKRDYRAGFIAGYRDGYYSGGGHGPGAVSSRFGHGRPAYRNAPGATYPRRTPVAVDIARSRGFDEGYRKGLDDGRDRDRRNPSRHKVYRNADKGYRREFGPKNVYKQAFRNAFARGYAEGYRNSRRGGRSGAPGPGW